MVTFRYHHLLTQPIRPRQPWAATNIFPISLDLNILVRRKSHLLRVRGTWKGLLLSPPPKVRLLGPLPLEKFALQLSPGSKFPLLSFWGMVWGAGLTEECLRDIAGSAPSY